MHRISDTLTQVKNRIHEAASNAGRKADDITLLAVSKKQTAEKIAELYALGVRNIGENYLQEAQEKQLHLAHLDICWHFIGPIQSNKAKYVSQSFDWVHSIDKIKTAQKISDNRPTNQTPMNICIQVNIDNEDSKSGVKPHEAAALAKKIIALPNLHLRGIMVLPNAQSNECAQRASFLKTSKLLSSLRESLNIELDTLSMGMSGDIEAAIAEGATIVRIGTALFGPRT